MNQPASKKDKTEKPTLKVTSLHEEPLSGSILRKEVCKICGKGFKTHSELDRHIENVHGEPEKTHTGPHKVE